MHRDIILVVISVIAGILMVKLNIVGLILTTFNSPLLIAFIAGIFFTSLLTISPASVVLAQLGLHGAPLEIAFFGALGAVVGDLLLFYFIKDSVSAEIGVLIKNGMHHYHLDKLHSKYARWVLPLVGALVIASPLPDELGIMLMGAAKTKVKNFIPISFIMNFIGVLLVIAAGQLAMNL